MDINHLTMKPLNTFLSVLFFLLLVIQSTQSQDLAVGNASLRKDFQMENSGPLKSNQEFFNLSFKRGSHSRKNLFLIPQAGLIFLDQQENFQLAPTISLSIRKTINNSFHQIGINAFAKEYWVLGDIGNWLSKSREIEDRSFSLGYSFGQSFTKGVLSGLNGSLYVQLGYRNIVEHSSSRQFDPISLNHYFCAFGFSPEYLVRLTESLGILANMDFPLLIFTQKSINYEDPIILFREPDIANPTKQFFSNQISLRLGIVVKIK